MTLLLVTFVSLPSRLGQSDTEGVEIMNVLNQIDGINSTYDGYGGTDDEIIAVLDDILGV